MRIYHHHRRPHTLYTSPAGDPRGVRGGIDGDWLHEDGSPKLLSVNFDAEGAAEVPDSLGRYLIETRQAKRTRLFLPSFMAA